MGGGMRRYERIIISTNVLLKGQQITAVTCTRIITSVPIFRGSLSNSIIQQPLWE